MIYGGLPQIVSFQSERQKADYLKNIFANVYLKDVIERNKIQSVDEIGILVDVLASAIGVPTNPSKIANTFASERQMSYTNKTISNHIDYLADAFLISKASRYDIKGRKYIGANMKYYFTDLGLRNANAFGFVLCNYDCMSAFGKSVFTGIGNAVKYCGTGCVDSVHNQFWRNGNRQYFPLLCLDAFIYRHFSGTMRRSRQRTGFGRHPS